MPTESGVVLAATPGADSHPVTGTGRIRALSSKRPPGLDQLDLAAAGPRQPGSAFKPLAAIAALEAGVDLAQPLEGRNAMTCDLDPEDWEVHDFGDADSPPEPLAGALEDSVNAAIAQLGVVGGPKLPTWPTDWAWTSIPPSARQPTGLPRVAAAVWVGDPRERVPIPTATGGSAAAPAWRDVMAAALAGQAQRSFAPGGELPPRPSLTLPQGRPPEAPAP